MEEHTAITKEELRRLMDQRLEYELEDAYADWLKNQVSPMEEFSKTVDQKHKSLDEQITQKHQQLAQNTAQAAEYQRQLQQQIDLQFAESQRLMQQQIAQIFSSEMQKFQQQTNPKTSSAEFERRSNPATGNIQSIRSFNCNPKVEITKFDGYGVHNWIRRYGRYFELCRVPDKRKVELASLHMIGKAKEWINWYLSVGRGVRWNDFIVDLIVCFRDLDRGSVVEQWDKLQQVDDLGVNNNDVHYVFDEVTGLLLGTEMDVEVGGGPNKDVADCDCVAKAVVVPKLEKEKIGAADEATVAWVVVDGTELTLNDGNETPELKALVAVADGVEVVEVGVEAVAFVTVENKVEEAVPKLIVEVVETALVVDDAADATFASPIEVVKTDAGEFSSIVATGFNTVPATYFFVDGVSIIEGGCDGGRSLWNCSEYNLQFQNGWKEKPLPWRDKIEIVLEVDASFKVFSHPLLSYALQLVKLIPTHAEEFVVELEANTGILVAYSYASVFDFHTSHSAVKIFDPGGLSFVIEMVKVETVAQFGEIFLLFALGLDFSTAKLRVVQAVAVMGGLFQIFFFMYLCGLTASLCGVCGLTASLCGAVVLRFLMEKSSVNALHGGYLTASAMFSKKMSTKEVDEQMIKSFSHELNFKGVRPFPLWKPQRMNNLEEVWVMIRAKFDKAKEEVDSVLRVFAVHRVETLDKNVESHLEWQETIEDLLVMVWSCAMTSGREFWLHCESIIQELDDRRQDLHMCILKQLHTRMLFILIRYTKLLQFHKESGVFEDEHALNLHQSFHIVSLFCIAGLCTAVGLIKLRKEEIMQLVHDLGEEFQALGKPVRELTCKRASIHSSTKLQNCVWLG